jgi:hypothetical protein
MLAVLLFQALVPVLVGQQYVPAPTSYVSVCNMTKAVVRITLVETHTVQADGCAEFNLGAPDSRTVTLSTTDSRVVFSASVKARDGKQVIYLVTNRKSCPSAAANRACVVAGRH